MARISSYNLDTSVSKTDKVIGTDSSGNTTKNFKLQDVAEFFNTASIFNVNGQVVYKFKTQSFPNAGEFNLPNGATSSFSTITQFLISHINSNDQNIKDYLNYFEGLNIMITQTDNPNTFATYAIETVSSNVGENYATFEVGFIEGSGSLIVDSHYAISYLAASTATDDKNFVFPIDGVSFHSFSGGSPFTITHSLNKYPSVTIMDSAGSEIYGDIQHINKNSFNITFNTNQSARVFVN